ncbi:MAG: hypothetical protein LBT40_01405 [Deltaproteobacteria bacterium]|jgi:hypothetical protein|nr:hypothetical protein [Deltaproteobacteria bacterium]
MKELAVGGHTALEVNPEGVREADVVMGLYAWNDAANMELAVAKCSGGAVRYRPDLRSVLVCSDMASEDGTREAFLSVPSETPRIYVSTSAERAERTRRGSFFNIVSAAHRLGARAVVTFAASTATLKKTWFHRLLDPVLDNGACFTSPLYSRHAFDLPITYLLSYPFFRALFGRRIRNPHLGDCAFSGELNEVFLNTRTWPDEPHFCSTELATAAIASSRGPVFQSFMGDPRVGRERLPVDASIGEDFCKTLRSFYQLMAIYPEMWKKPRNSRPTPVIGAGIKGDILPPRQLVGAPAAFLPLIANGIRESRGIWESEFAYHMPLWHALKDPPPRGLKVSSEDWADLVYRGAASYRCMAGQGEMVVRALMPVFLARLLDYQLFTTASTAAQVSAAVESECEVFEKAKPRLVALWGD